MRNRRRVRVGLKVIHRHQVGDHTMRRVSELVFVRGEAKAVLGWIDMAGDRTPVYLALERARLSPAKGVKGTFHYDGVTVDPRFEEFDEMPAPRARL